MELAVCEHSSVLRRFGDLLLGLSRALTFVGGFGDITQWNLDG